MIGVSANLDGIGAYVGTVKGFLEAVEDPRFEGDFVGHLMDKVASKFTVETIAVHESGNERLAHVFEWGEEQGETSNIPLFKLTRGMDGGTPALGYTFLPSTKYVPLPDPDRYGFSPDKLQHLRRHTFQLKALVMETKSRVNVSPIGSKKLFIPSEKAKRGYVMYPGTVKINPGGAESTGAFANWWLSWFENRAQAVVSEETQKTEDFLVATGRKYVRYASGTVINGVKVGGRFASGRNVSVGYVDSKAESVKRKVLAESEKFFDEDAYWEQFDE